MIRILYILQSRGIKMSKCAGMCITAILIFCVILLALSSNITYNNTDPKEQLISKEYSASQVDEMIENIDRRLFKKHEFIKKYNVECLRRIPQGYYAVFQRDDGKFVYVFLYDDLVPVANATIVVDKFKSKEEFLRFLSEDRFISDMIEFDSTTIFPFSGRNASIHHVIEGVFLVDYSNSICSFDDAKVAHIDFIEDNEILHMEDSLNIPYILCIDRKN